MQLLHYMNQSEYVAVRFVTHGTGGSCHIIEKDFGILSQWNSSKHISQFLFLR